MPFILDLAILFITAVIGGRLVRKLGQPPSLGEMLVGIIIGPYALGVVTYTDTLRTFAELGSIFLLFIIGLKTAIESFYSVWKPAIAAGVGGAIVPFFLGFLAASSFGFTIAESLFLGAVLTATSIGITARVLSDMHKLNTKEGVTILGAAVADDVVGIIVLTVILGVIAGGLTLISVVSITAKAILAWFLILLIGMRIIARVFNKIKLNEGALTLIFLATCLGFAFVTSQLGLSSIVGAFAIGLALSRTFKVKEALQELNIIYRVFVPIFFISIGLLVDISVFLKALPLGLLVTVLAIAGKLIGCGVVVFLMGFKLNEALRVGIGMIPRGEMGLIIAGIGLTSGLIGSEIYSIGVIAIVLTTFLAIPLMKPTFGK